MILNLNGAFSFPLIHQRLVLIELHSGKLTETLDLVRPFFLRWGEVNSLRRSTTQMPQMPSMIVVTIAATRIYRSLINFASSDM